jgi:nitrogenase molybdenum-cofactor synthesis protein NifE
MVDLVREIARAIFNPVWQQVRIPAPWGDDGETLGVVQAIATAPEVAPIVDAVVAPQSGMNYLTAVAAQSMGLEPEEVPA